MKSGRSKHSLSLGIICLFYWTIDFIFNALIPKKFDWTLWYSSIGLLGTGIALITENIILIYSLFCALFIPETAWLVSFLGAFLFHNNFLGLVLYPGVVNFTKKDFYLTLYHFLIPVSLFYAVKHTKKTYPYGWLGATVFATLLALLTLLLVSPYDQVNCIESLTPCKTIFSFLYAIPNPQRIFLVLFAMTIFVYVPTSLGAVKMRETIHK